MAQSQQCGSGHKRDHCPNWVMIAGGALVVALGLALGRKQIQSVEAREDQSQATQPRSRPSNDHGKGECFDLAVIGNAGADAPSKKGSPGAAHDSDSPMKSHEPFDDNFSPDGATSSQLSWIAPRAAAIYWGNSGATSVSPHPHFDLKSKRSHTATPSQPASKPSRQDPNSRDEMFQSDASFSSPALRAGLAARREMVHQLRKQLRSRDGIIFDLQAQVSDQDQVITMQRAETADLQARLTTTNTALLRANHEIQRLSKELRTQSGKLASKANDNSEDRSHSANSGLRDVTTELEVRIVNDKLKRLQGEKQDLESQVQAFSRECELLFRKASALEAERVQLKKLLTEKGHMLEAKEQECTELSTTLANLTSANIGDGDHCGGDLVRSYNSLFRQSPGGLEMTDDIVSKRGSRSTAREFTSSPNYDGPDYDLDESVTMSVVWSLQQEVYELSEALACRSKAVSERKLETSRVLTEFQATQTPSLCGPEEICDWEDLSQVLTFSHDGTSVEQLQELSHKLEKVAKQQQVEDEIEALCRHQDQISALKSRLTKLSAKCNADNVIKDQPFNESAHRMAGMILDLADKLSVQEDQVRETTIDIQQLSMSLQLSSPYVPRSKKQELQRMLQGGSRHSYSPVFAGALHKDISISTDPPFARSCYFAGEQKSDVDRSSRLFDRQISFSSLPNKVDAFTESAEKLSNKLPKYEFQEGAFDLLPDAKARNKACSLRKPTVNQFSTRTGPNWDNTSNVKNSSSAQPRISFTPEEATSGGFAFRLHVKDENREVGDARDSSFGCVVDSNDFQSSREGVDEAPDRKSNSGELSSDIVTPTSDDKWFSSAVRIGSPTVSGAAAPPICVESSRDNLRRFLFKPDEQSSGGSDGKFEEIASEIERESGDDDGDGEVQIKRLDSEKVSPSVLVTSSCFSNTGQLHDVQCSARRQLLGIVGVSPFPARMACVDVKRSTSSYEDVTRGATMALSEDEQEEGSLNIASKMVVGKENMRTNALFYSGNQTVSRMISSKDNWEGSQSMAAAKDIFRCDRRKWN